MDSVFLDIVVADEQVFFDLLSRHRPAGMRLVSRPKQAKEQKALVFVLCNLESLSSHFPSVAN